MSIIGRHFRRLIVIALVSGLSVGACSSPTALAELLDWRQGFDASATAATDLVASPYRTSMIRTAYSQPSPRIAAESADLENADHHDIENGVAKLSAVVGHQLRRMVDAKQRNASAHLRTLLSMGVCWRV
jgi:hypothetical protein